MSNPTAASKPAGTTADRVERLLTPKSNDSEVEAELRQQVRKQASLLQKLVNRFRTAEDMRLLTAQRNKQLADENKCLKDKMKSGTIDSVTKKGVESPVQMSTAEVSTISVQPPSLTTSGSAVTLTKEQMTELAESVAALKEVAFRRENTWERMAQRQVGLQKQIKNLKENLVLATRRLEESSQTIKDQAAASKKDKVVIASLKRELNRIGNPPRLEKKSSVVEVMAPPKRRPPLSAAPGDAVTMLAGYRTPAMHGTIDSPGSRGSSRKEHHHDRRERYGEMGHVLGKLGLYSERVVDKPGYYVEKRGMADRREHILERRVVENVSDRRTSERISSRPLPDRVMANDRRNMKGP